jgi:LemA protein
MPYVLIGVALLLLIYVLYASLITKRNKALEAFSGIDVQLKKRHDLIPNILTIAKKFMEHEKNLMKEITELRTAAQSGAGSKDTADIKKRLATENALQQKLGQFFVSVENYPQLKSNESMLHAQQTYNEVEEQISAARRFYNSAVNELNNSVQIFPGSVIASMINVQALPFFEAASNEKGPVDAASIL